MPFSVAPAAYAILALTVVVSWIGLAASPRLIDRNLLRPYEVARGRELGTLITCGFVHADFGHLIFNGLTLYFFGPPLEYIIGTTSFLLLYFIGLVVSSTGTVIKHRDNRDYASLGASGAILAVLFAFIVYRPTAPLALFFVLPMPAVVFAFGYLAYTWWSAKHPHGRVNHDAHLDGALTGLLFVALTDWDAWGHALHTVGKLLAF